MKIVQQQRCILLFVCCILQSLQYTSASYRNTPWATQRQRLLFERLMNVHGGESNKGKVEDDVVTVLKEISSPSVSMEPLSYPTNMQEAAQDFSMLHGNDAYKFLRGLASSATFREKFWHKKPLLIQSKNRNNAENTAAASAARWVRGAFTVENDLKLVGGSFISGHRTADIMRNGTNTETWHFRPLKDNPARPTTWEEVEDAMKGGTIYFNTAGSLWPNLGGLCRLTIAAFGIPANINVYVTPPGQTLSVPPHTDRQDVLVFQTQGAKRWRVYAPPPRSKDKDPLNRGKAGDVLSFEEMDDRPLIDTVLKAGDILYVPTGFPHTTDTCTVVSDGDDTDQTREDVFRDTSVHLTMGLDTHVWALTFAHMRWSLLQRCKTDFNLNVSSDELYWRAMETIPIGFLNPALWVSCLDAMKNGRESIEPDLLQPLVTQIKELLFALEPARWRADGTDDDDDDDDNNKNKEALPDDSVIAEVVDYMFLKHLKTLMEIQDDMFSNIKCHDEESLIKAFKCSQRQNAVMEEFGRFSQNAAMEQSFSSQREQRDKKVSGGL